jgi:hypothetical protein
MDGVTCVTEVGVLNCDCEELGFAVSGIRGDVVCAFGSSIWRGPEPEVSMSARFCDDAAWTVTYVCEGVI